MKSSAHLLVSVFALALMLCHPHLLGQTAPTVETLHSFTNGGDGGYPQAGLIQGRDGNFYGTTTMGGIGYGTVFQITPAGVLTTLYSFTNTGTDGANPVAGVIQGSDGNFYGTTEYGGGNSNDGTVFRITPAGAITILHSFTEFDTDGGNPVAGLVQGSNGDFYGTTSAGGNSDGNGGTVFRITPKGGYTTLHSFPASSTDGSDPIASLIEGSDGNLYGTTTQGGDTNNGAGYGTIFKITPAGALSILYSFTGEDDGAQPFAALVQGKDGNFYGTTRAEGEGSGGTVFKITPAGVLTTLYGFGNSSKNGYQPFGALAQGSDGNFYGTTVAGGYNNGNGTIFQITPTGTVLTLHSFTNSGTDGGSPKAGLIQGTDGNFYGTTYYGGSSGAGTIFRLDVSPVVTSAASATATVGKAFSYQITATNNPTKYGVGGLFKGITVNQQTGLISGTPMAAGKHTLTLRAANIFGTGAKTLTLTVVGKPAINSADTATAQVGKAFSYRITATNSPTQYGAQGLRDNLTANSSTGIISGTPTSPGEITLTIEAGNTAGVGTAPLKINVLPAEPVITSPGTATAQIGKAFSYQITATNGPTQYGAKGLQQGLTADASTGIISGTPKSAGTITVTLQAANAGGTGTKTLTLTIQPN